MIVNLTPHDIDIRTPDGGTRTVPPSGVVARVASHTERVGEVDGVPVTHTHFGPVRGLPEPVKGTVYVVSALVAQRVPDRPDVLIPAEGVRDERGRIVACRSLARVGAGKVEQ